MTMDITSDYRARYLEAYRRAWNEGEVDELDSVIAPSYRRSSSTGGESTLEQLKETIRANRAAFPDLMTTVDDCLLDGDRFVLRWTSRGTHRATYLGVPPTGRQVTVSGITIARLDESIGYVVDEWVTWDPTDLLTALGISSLHVPTPADGRPAGVEDAVVREVHRKFVTGVTVVTTTDENQEPRGLVVNAFVSVSLQPPLILVCVARTSSTYAALMAADSFAVNILAADQGEVVARFAKSGPDKFQGVQWNPGLLGVPVLTGSAGYFEAEVSERVQASTHTMFIGHVRAAGTSPRAPLVYLGGDFHDPAGLEAAGAR